MRTLYEDVFTFMRTRSVFFFSENHVVYEIMWENVVEPERPQTTIQYGARDFACWVSKAVRAHADPHAHTYTHTEENVILIEFPRQQWFRERALVLCCTHIACLVCNSDISTLKVISLAEMISMTT